MKKRLLTFCLLMMLVVSSIVPAYAEDGDEHTPSPYTNMEGNGYAVREVVYGGRTYDARLSLSFSASYGARATVSCNAAIAVNIGTVTAKFITISYGYVTNSGGATRVELTGDNHVGYSGYVACSRGMAQVEGYESISGSATFYGDKSVSASTTMKP